MSLLANVIGRGLAADKPASPHEGWLYYETDNEQWVRYSGSAWEAAPGVTHPASSTDNAIARWDGAGGDTLQDSGVTIDDSGNIALPDATYLATDEIRARDAGGLGLYDDDGAFPLRGIFIQDGGTIGVGTLEPDSNVRMQIDDTGTLPKTILLLRYQLTRAEGNEYGLEFRDSSNEATAAISVEQGSVNNQGSILFSTNNGTGGNGLGVTTERVRITGAGNVGIGVAVPGSLTEWGFATENLEFVDAGSTGATEQDFVEVQVGGVTGYIRVYATK